MSESSYRDLLVWQRSMKLAKRVYRAIEKLPKHELYALTAQIRRSVISVPCNIAEGQGRWSSREFEHFLTVARGSLVELETQLLLAVEFDYLTAKQISGLLTECGEIGRMINGLRASLARSATAGN